MSALLKVLGIGGIGAASLAAIYFVGQTEDLMPNWYPASDDDSASSTYSDGKYANKYQRYLVGSGKGDSNNNDKWWDWSFRNRYLTSQATENFKGIETSGKLKEACLKAYKGTKSTSGDTTTITEGNDKYKEEEIWKYCSSGRTKIKTISEVTGEKDSYNDTNSYAKTNGNDGKLVSIQDTDSDWFWSLKEQEFLKDTDPTEQNKESSEFKKLWKEKTKRINDSSREVKNICKEAYGKSSTTDSEKYPTSDVFKFCSLKGTNS